MTSHFAPRQHRRLLGALGALALSAGLVSCAAEASGPSAVADDRPVVLTTFTVLADIAGNVGGDKIRVESITKVGAEIHGYEPTPRDIAKANDADLILDNGLNLEAWFSKFVDELDVPHAVLTKGVTPMDITAEEDAGKPNPHAWMSPVNVQQYVENISEAFATLDPQNAEYYATNAAGYQKELQTVHDSLVTGLAALPKAHRALVTCEGAFSYMARDAGLTEKYIWPVNAESQATPRQITAVIEFVKDNEVPAVFCESTVSDTPMQQVVEATDAEFGGMLYVDSLSEAGGPVPTYLELIRHDSELILDALSGTKS